MYFINHAKTFQRHLKQVFGNRHRINGINCSEIEVIDSNPSANESKLHLLSRYFRLLFKCKFCDTNIIQLLYKI